MNRTGAAFLVCWNLVACGHEASEAPTASPTTAAVQEEEIPPLDAKNIVSIAVGSPDHTTLVTAIKAAHYVTGVANAGPLTVFAPVNAAFAGLPAGTVDNLLKPENADQLRHVLQHHVMPSVYTAESFRDGQQLGMVDGTKATVHIVDGKVHVDDATILTSIRASNGIIHVIDKVLLPHT